MSKKPLTRAGWFARAFLVLTSLFMVWVFIVKIPNSHQEHPIHAEIFYDSIYMETPRKYILVKHEKDNTLSFVEYNLDVNGTHGKVYADVVYNIYDLVVGAPAAKPHVEITQYDWGKNEPHESSASKLKYDIHVSNCNPIPVLPVLEKK